jgi:predicted metal-binding protein
MTYEALIQAALDCGASKATVIDVEQVVLSEEVRNMCAANRCGLYGKCWVCPPDIGPIEETMAKVRRFSKGLWYQRYSDLEDSFDFEGMVEAKKEFVKVSQRLNERLGQLFKGEYLHLGGGGCGLCETCAKATGEPCRFPEKALSSIEAYGVDVYNTTKSTDLKYINGQDTVTYFGMVLFEEETHV